MKKKVLKFLETTVAPFILQLLVKFIYLTNKITYHRGSSLDSGETYIISMWHGDLLMQPFNYRNFKQHGTVKGMISEHRDGEALRKTVEYLGIGSLYGSSTRGGVKALLGAIKAIKKGTDVAITPDGPKGPIYNIADGVVIIAQKTNSKILPFSCVPSKYWQLRSWDKFIIPKPFGKIDFYIGDAIDVKDMEIETAKSLLKSRMHKNQVTK